MSTTNPIARATAAIGAAFVVYSLVVGCDADAGAAALTGTVTFLEEVRKQLILEEPTGGARAEFPDRPERLLAGDRVEVIEARRIVRVISDAAPLTNLALAFHAASPPASFAPIRVHTITATGNGEDAAQLWQPGRFDGFEATTDIRSCGGATPIIALTALRPPIQAIELQALQDEYLSASPVERDS